MQNISGEQLKEAIEALYQYNTAKKKKEYEEKKTQPLIEDEDYIYLLIVLHKIPGQEMKSPKRIDIPHTIYGREGTSICLFTKDPKSDYKDKLEDKPVTNIEQVIDVSTLRKHYKTYEDRRKLCKRYTLFMTDDRIVPMLPRIIGKDFFKKKKLPVTVKLNAKDITNSLEQARDSTFALIKCGPCQSIRIGTTLMPKTHVYENIIESINNIIDLIPRKWKNVQSVSIKTNNSIALPFYRNLPQVTRIDRGEHQEQDSKDNKKKVKKYNNNNNKSGGRKNGKYGHKRKLTNPAPKTKTWKKFKTKRHGD